MDHQGTSQGSSRSLEDVWLRGGDPQPKIPGEVKKNHSAINNHQYIQQNPLLIYNMIHHASMDLDGFDSDETSYHFIKLQNESGCDNDAILSCCSSILARSSIGARLAGKCPTTSSQNG